MFSVKVFADSAGYKLVSALRLKTPFFQVWVEFLLRSYGGFCFFVLVYLFNVCPPAEHKHHEAKNHSSFTLHRVCRDETRLDGAISPLFVTQGLGEPFFT